MTDMRFDLPPGVSDDTPVFVISVAATLAGMHPQTLRQYDRIGLVSPGRTSGRGRRYSVRDIAMLRETLRLDCLVMKAKFPGLSHRNVMDSLRLFGERVLPNVQH